MANTIDLTEWNEIKSDKDVPKGYNTYMAYCENANLLYKKSKTADLIYKMYLVKQVSHWKEA